MLNSYRWERRGFSQCTFLLRETKDACQCYAIINRSHSKCFFIILGPYCGTHETCSHQKHVPKDFIKAMVLWGQVVACPQLRIIFRKRAGIKSLLTGLASAETTQVE